jgi:tight adherence protein C
MALGFAFAAGLFLFLFFYLVVITKIAPKTQVKERVQRLRAPFSLDEQQDRFESENRNRPFTERIILPIFHQLEKWLIRLTPARIYEVLAERILRAGKQHIWSVNVFICFWMLSSISFMAIVVFVFYVKHMAFVQVFALLFCALIFGTALPVVFLDSLITQRRKAILRQLPEVLDLLCVSVQAGLSFDGAMTRVADKMKGPLIEECRKMLHDVRMGMTKRLALANMAERCRIQEVHLFTVAVIQADRLGVSMAKTMVMQSENMRERRRQAVKEQALKAPVKMLLPLAVFIFPALFVVILLPTVFSILRNLGSIAK